MKKLFVDVRKERLFFRIENTPLLIMMKEEELDSFEKEWKEFQEQNMPMTYELFIELL